MRSVINGNGEIIKLLLEAEHVDPNFQLAADGRTAFMVAAENVSVGAVKLLLSGKRASRRLRDRNRRKALCRCHGLGTAGKNCRMILLPRC